MAIKVYQSTCHTKKCWSFGISRSPSSFTVDFWIWGWTIYDDDL